MFFRQTRPGTGCPVALRAELRRRQDPRGCGPWVAVPRPPNRPRSVEQAGPQRDPAPRIAPPPPHRSPSRPQRRPAQLPQVPLRAKPPPAFELLPPAPVAGQSSTQKGPTRRAPASAPPPASSLQPPRPGSAAGIPPQPLKPRGPAGTPTAPSRDPVVARPRSSTTRATPGAAIPLPGQPPHSPVPARTSRQVTKAGRCRRGSRQGSSRRHIPPTREPRSNRLPEPWRPPTAAAGAGNVAAEAPVQDRDATNQS